MASSLYDFDTRYAPFAAFAPLMPYAPFALMAWFVAPMQWWAEAWLNTCDMLSKAAPSSMVYPYVMPPIPLVGLAGLE